MEEEEAQEVELEEEENKSKSLNSPRSSKKLRKHRIVRDFDKEAVIEAKFNLAEHTYDDLRKEAYNRRVTMGYLVREALESYLSQLKAEAEKEAETERHAQFGEAVTLIRSCKKEGWLGSMGFEIEGEDGFINRVGNSGLDPAVWDDDLLEALAQHLVVGCQGYLSPPNPNELFERVSDAMGISDEKREVFLKAFSSALGKEE